MRKRRASLSDAIGFGGTLRPTEIANVVQCQTRSRRASVGGGFSQDVPLGEPKQRRRSFAELVGLPSASPLAFGTQVVISGMIGRTDLNGRRGISLGPTAKGDRIVVRTKPPPVPGGRAEDVHIKPENLEAAAMSIGERLGLASEAVGSECTICDLKKRSDLNGRIATVLGREGDCLVVRVARKGFRAEEDVRLPPANLRRVLPFAWMLEGGGDAPDDDEPAEAVPPSAAAPATSADSEGGAGVPASCRRLLRRAARRLLCGCAAEPLPLLEEARDPSSSDYEHHEEHHERGEKEACLNSTQLNSRRRE